MNNRNLEIIRSSLHSLAVFSITLHFLVCNKRKVGNMRLSGIAEARSKELSPNPREISLIRQPNIQGSMCAIFLIIKQFIRMNLTSQWHESEIKVGNELLSDPEIKLDIHVLPKSARIIISIGLSISESFQNRVGVQQFVLCSLYWRNMLRGGCNKLKDLFRCFRLAGSGFALKVTI